MSASNGYETTNTPGQPRYTVYGLAAGGVLIALAILLYLLPVSVGGKLTDAETGQPVANTAVTLSSGEQVRSDDQGRFSARGSRLQSLSATVDAPQYQPWEGRAAFGFLPLAPARLEAALQPTVLEARVVNALDGATVPDATIKAGDQTLTSDGDGKVTLRRLPRAGAQVTLAADGFIAYDHPLGDWPADGQPVDLPIYPNGLHGVVTDAANGEPLPGAALALNGAASQSQATGFFYLPPDAGTGLISVTLPGYLPATIAVTSEAALSGEEPAGIALQPNVLSGQVTDGQTGAPLSGVIVTAGEQSTTTDDDGRYHLERVHGSEVLVTAQLNGYESTEKVVDEAVHLINGKALDLPLLPPHLAGRLVNNVTQGPVVGAAVKAGDLTATSDAHGEFILWTTQTPLKIAVEAAGYEATETEFTADTELSVPLEPKGVVMTVVDNAGQPVAGVTVAGPRSETTTDAQGIALLPLLEPGEVFTATAENFAPLAQAFDGEAQQRLALFPDTLAGQVIDAKTGQGITGAIVYVYDRAVCQGEACRGTEPAVMVEAEDDGNFELTGMPAAPQLMVKAPGYSLLFPEELQPGDCGAPYCLEAKLEPFEARGFYVPFHYLYDRKLIESRLDLIADSDVLNAVVVDMKSDYGKIAWEPQNAIAKEIGVYESEPISAQEFLQEAKKRGIYTIARFVTFKDNALAEGKPEWALAKKSNPGALWKDGENLAWVDPYRQEVRQYEIDLAKELSALGFDEIQFDYFRFTGQTDHNQFTYSVESTAENRRQAITSFSHELMEALKPYGIFTAIDVFGSIILNGSEPYIGQDLSDMAKGLDYLSPMIYPQVWWPGTFPGCDEPVLCPYKVIYDSTDTVRNIVPLPTRIRPWLQGYPNNYRTSGPAAGYNYEVPEMMIQRQAAEDAGAEGWLFWSGGGNFPDEIFGPMPALQELEAQVRARQGGRGGPP